MTMEEKLTKMENAKDKSSRYEEWLTTIANTRLIYNTMDELEGMLDNHAIHSNGIKRSFSSPQKMRAAFRDLEVEVKHLTSDGVDLVRLLEHYKKAWVFYRDNLYRRSNPEEIASELLSYCYYPHSSNGIGKKKNEIYERVDKENLNIPFLLLFLFKAIPGYDSKEGDVVDIQVQYERVLKFLESYTSSGTLFNPLPGIKRAREEKNKTRLMLLYHLKQILNTYESYSEPENLYETTSFTKQNLRKLNIEGFWNETGGQLINTDFWTIEEARQEGTYFFTHWYKDAKNRLTGISYSIVVAEDVDNSLKFTIVHPMAIKHKMDGAQFSDGDIAWYRSASLEDTPSDMVLRRLFKSTCWPPKIHLSRCVTEAAVAQYERWLNECTIVNKFSKYEYELYYGIHAITQSHIYLCSEVEGEFYKVPKSAHKGLDLVQLSDNAGVMLMDGKFYIVFDELLLFISTNEDELQHYGIERVKCVE